MPRIDRSAKIQISIKSLLFVTTLAGVCLSVFLMYPCQVIDANIHDGFVRIDGRRIENPKYEKVMDAAKARREFWGVVPKVNYHPDDLIGKDLGVLLSGSILKDIYHWNQVNMPLDDDAMSIFIFEEGDLEMRVGADNKIATANFHYHTVSAQERIASFEAAWSDFGRRRSR